MVSVYGLTYFAACVLLTLICFIRRSYLKDKIASIDLVSKIVWIAIFTILGGRLGYVLGYEPWYYMERPIEILQLYKGGMSFHGGLLGCIISTVYLAKVKYSSGEKHKNHSKNICGWFFDCLCLTALIILPLGRIVNFFNGEAFGRITDIPWAVIFLNIDLNPRHPSQIYEAIAEGPILYVLLFLVEKIKSGWCFQGEMALCFMFGYGLLRFFIEFTREADFTVGYIEGWGFSLTLGQILCLLQILMAIVIWVSTMRKS